MNALIRSELLKLRTARSFIIMVSLGVGIAALISLATAVIADYSSADPDPGLDMISNASVVLFFTLMLGVLSLTTEYRHGSIASALLVEPDRRRLLAAKLVAATLVGAAIGLVTAGLCLAIGAAILPGRGHPLGLDGERVVKLLAGMAAAGALTAALGVGVGALVRKQTAAIVGILVYLLLVEPILTSVVVKSTERYAIGNLLGETAGIASVNGLNDPFGQIHGGLLLLGWAALFALLGGLVMYVRDVTD